MKLSEDFRMKFEMPNWSSNLEAVISNLKRGYNLARCIWKGREQFVVKVLWIIIAYNIRVMTAHVVRLI